MPVSIVGASAGIRKSVGNHNHTAWEIVLNTQGQGYSRIKNRDYFFGPGTIICQPPDVPHAKESEGGFADIYIQPTFFSLSKYADENGVIILQDDYMKSFETLIRMAFRAFHDQEASYTHLVDALYEAMNQLLLVWVDHRPRETIVEQVKTRLINSFSNPEFSLSELSVKTGYCEDHLRRRFKKATGMTPVQYLMDLRINFAKKLMMENDALHHTIAEIGAMSGYYDSRYFSRVFKKATGMTPREYLVMHSVKAKKE